MKKLSIRKRTIQFLSLLFLAAGLLVTIGFCVNGIRTDQTDPSESVPESASESETAASAEPSKVIFLNDYLHIHEIGAAAANDPARPDDDVDHCVRIAYLYQGRRPEMAFVSSDNPKANEMLKDFRQEELRCEPYHDYQYARMELWFDYSLLQPGESVTVNSITVSLDGEETTFATKGNLILSRVTEAEEQERENGQLPHVIEGLNYMGELLPAVSSDAFPKSLNINGVAYQDITIQQIVFTDWFQIMSLSLDTGNGANATVVTGISEGLLPTPVTVSYGMPLHISLNVKPNVVEWHPFSEFRTELQIRYLDENGKEGVLPLVFEGSALVNPAWICSITDTATAGSMDGDAEKIVFLEDMAEFTVNNDVEVLFLYRDEEETPYLQLKEFESEEVAAALTDYSFEMGSQGAYLGYRIGAAKFKFDWHLLEPGKRVPVGKIRLLVGKTEVTLDLTEQVVLVGLSKEWEYPPKSPVFQISSNGIQDREGRCVLTLKGKALQQVTLQKWDMGDVLPFGTEQVKVRINGKEISSLGLFPLTLQTEDTIEIETDYKYEHRLRDTGVVYYTDAAGEARVSVYTAAKGGTRYDVKMAREAYKRFLNDLKERGKI